MTTLAPLQEALDGAEWILHAATQDLPCLREVGLVPTPPLRHRARRPAARLSARRPGHARGDRARPAHAQGALRGRLVDPPAAHGLARLRRPRRRGAPRAARAHDQRAREGRQDRVGPPGVRAPAGLRARRAPGGLAAYVRGAPAARAPRPRRGPRAVGGARRDRRRARRHPGPDPARLRDRRRRHRHADRPARAAVARRASTAAAPAATPRTWVDALAAGARDDRGRAALPAPPAATARRTRAPGPSASPSPTAASRRPARRCSTSPRSTTCRWRTC